MLRIIAKEIYTARIRIEMNDHWRNIKINKQIKGTVYKE